MAGTVLIVDDSATMRRMIKRTLAMSGLAVSETREASNGIEALAQMAAGEVAAVILDINMPVMNGVKLISRMRDDKRLAHIPVVIASTEGSQTRIQELAAAGALGFVRKPFQPEALRAVLEPILGLGPENALAVEDDSDDSF
jgi:two-component system chemotaxis response regulator CheY